MLYDYVSTYLRTGIKLAKNATLTSALVTKKGQASPAVPPGPTKQPASSSAAYYKALTVKLDKHRYQVLKSAGVQLDKSSQDIFVEALDEYLARLAPRG